MPSSPFALNVDRMHIFGNDVVNAALSLSIPTIGAGVLAIPSTIEAGGIILACVVNVFVAIMTVISLDYIVLCADSLHLRSYEAISRELLGRWFEEAVRWILIVYLLGISSGYIVVIGEIFTPMLSVIQMVFPFITTTPQVMVFFWAFVMLPLSCVPSILRLRAVTALAISATSVMSLFIVFRYFFPLGEAQIQPKAETPINWFSFSRKGLLALPVMMFSFDCQALTFQVYGSLANGSRSKMLKVSTVSVIITSAVYLCVGVFGYLSHRPGVAGNILTYYSPSHDHLFALCEVMYSVTIFSAFALALFPCRDAVFLMLFGYNSASHERNTISNRDHIVASFVLALLSLLVALCAPGIVFVIALLGGVCSSSICFTYPSLFRLALHNRGILPCSWADMQIAVAMLLFGIAGGVLGTYVAFA